MDGGQKSANHKDYGMPTLWLKYSSNIRCPTRTGCPPLFHAPSPCQLCRNGWRNTENVCRHRTAANRHYLARALDAATLSPFILFTFDSAVFEKLRIRSTF